VSIPFCAELRAALCLLLAAAAAAVVVPVAPAAAAEHLTVTPSLTGRLGGAGTLGVDVAIASTLGGVPSPLTQLRFEVPAGATYHFATTPVCALKVIESSSAEPPRCPSGSRIGDGSAAVEGMIAGAPLNEAATLELYLTSRSPVRYEVWTRATTPVQQTLVFGGVFVATGPPYGGEISVAIPPIPTVPGAPDASIVSLDLTVGGEHPVTSRTTTRRGGRTVSRTVRTMDGLFDLPRRCPAVLPYAASTTYADGTSVGASGRLACP